MTIDFSLRSAAHLTHFFVVTPYEGTTLHEELEKWGIKRSDLDYEHFGYHDFSGDDTHGSLSKVRRSRIQELIVEATQRFYFDPKRMRRMMELMDHNHVHLAQQLETRRWSAGYDWSSIPSRESARLLAALFEEARALDPIACAHLPVPPIGLLQDVA